MIFKTSRVMINRELQREKIANLLTESGFNALEIFGVGGLGKSRILEAAKQECREGHCRSQRSISCLSTNRSLKTPNWIFCCIFAITLTNIRLQKLLRGGLIVKKEQFASLRNLLYLSFLRRKFGVYNYLPVLKLGEVNLGGLFWQIVRALTPAISVMFLVWYYFDRLIQAEIGRFLKDVWEQTIYTNFMDARVGLALISGIVVYLVSYMIIWLVQVYSYSSMYEVNLRTIYPGAPPLSFSFNRVARTGEQWNLSLRLVEPWTYPLKISGRPYKMLSWFGVHECNIKTEYPQGELVASFTVPFRWMTLFLPWPSNCIVPIEVTWSDSM